MAMAMDMTLADAPPCECDVLRVKTLGVFWCRAVVTFMCRSVTWGRGESRVSPVLVITRHPLLGGTIEIPLADLAQPLRVLDVTPRQEKRRAWSLALGPSSRRKLTLRASSAAQYAKWTRLTRQWLQLGHDMSASVVSASPTATATSDTTVAHHRHRRSPGLPAASRWEFETKAVLDPPVPWHLEMLPSPLSSASSCSDSTTYFTATTEPPASGSRIRLDSTPTTSDDSATDPPSELPPDSSSNSRSVFSLLQALQAQDASLETVSTGRPSQSDDDMSVGPLSEATTDGARDTAVSLGVADSARTSVTADWAHPTGRAPSSVASLSSWLSESDHEQGDTTSHRALAMLEPPPRSHHRADSSDEEQAEASGCEEENGREGGESFDYEASFPWVFTDGPDRQLVVITGPENQAVYFF